MQLKKIKKVESAEGSGTYYAEHFEWKPDVYAGSEGSKKIEYYFYENKLYKVFIIHSGKTKGKKDQYNTDYSRVVDKMAAALGKEKESFKESRFGFLIHHTIWEDNITQIDVRMGAGYVYSVHLYKTVNEKKAKDMENYVKSRKHESKEGIVDL